MEDVHTLGSKSYVRLREEEREKRPNGEEPTRDEVYILTHTHKDGKPVNEEAAAKIDHEGLRAKSFSSLELHVHVLTPLLVKGQQCLNYTETLRKSEIATPITLHQIVEVEIIELRKLCKIFAAISGRC
ncbi:uncharacterized protein LOC115952285 [Quercus lobata]|uniref:uncharacterized protein LOC115952285 n=1 Tax=Quercus lobata TaxID=97700 RepID=UPI0012480B42|nr:uncharacterized protein LOC115952285 [Quercus lobata]